MVEVESDISNGLPGFVLVGLPDATLNEARDRVRAALLNSGEEWPQRRRTVSMSPADLPKKGSHFDLAIAVAVAAAGGTVPSAALDGVVFLGELGLDGRARAVPGVLPAVLAASKHGFSRVVVPEANAGEATLLPDMAVLGIRSLRQLLAVLRGDLVPDEPPQAVADAAREQGHLGGASGHGRRGGAGRGLDRGRACSRGHAPHDVGRAARRGQDDDRRAPARPAAPA